MLICCFVEDVFFLSQCKKNSVLISVQLSESDGRSLAGALREDRSKGKLSVLWRACCYVRGEQNRVKREATERSFTVTKWMKDAEVTRWDAAKVLHHNGGHKFDAHEQRND